MEEAHSLTLKELMGLSAVEQRRTHRTDGAGEAGGAGGATSDKGLSGQLATLTFDHKKSYLGQLVPTAPTADELISPSRTYKEGNFLVLDDGLVLQVGKFGACWVRAIAHADGRPPPCTQSIEQALFRMLGWQESREKHFPVYVTLSASSMTAPSLLMLDRRGFTFHHYRPGADESIDNAEYVYKLWPGPDGHDPVPAYATSIEGCAALILSPGPEGPASKVLTVWERGGWSMCGGAVNPKESPLDAIKREAAEELNIEIDEEFMPCYLGGYQETCARDLAINDNFSVFLLKAKTEFFREDNVEIEHACWLPAGLDGSDGLLTSWEEAGRPGGNLTELGFDQWGEPYAQMPADKRKVKVRIMKALEAFMASRYLPCTRKTKEHAHKIEYGEVF